MNSGMRARLLWSNRATAVGTTLKKPGHSGPVDLSDISAVWLALIIGKPPVNFGRYNSSQSWISVQFEVREAAGVWIPVLPLTPQQPSFDDHSVQSHGSAGLFLSGPDTVSMVLPESGRVSWNLYGKAGAVYCSTTISLHGR